MAFIARFTAQNAVNNANPYNCLLPKRFFPPPGTLEPDESSDDNREMLRETLEEGACLGPFAFDSLALGGSLSGRLR